MIWRSQNHVHLTKLHPHGPSRHCCRRWRFNFHNGDRIRVLRSAIRQNCRGELGVDVVLEPAFSQRRKSVGASERRREEGHHLAPRQGTSTRPRLRLERLRYSPGTRISKPLPTNCLAPLVNLCTSNRSGQWTDDDVPRTRTTCTDASSRPAPCAPAAQHDSHQTGAAQRWAGQPIERQLDGMPSGADDQCSIVDLTF